MATKKTAQPKPDEGGAYKAPSVRIDYDWTPRKIRLAIQMAETGSLYYAASLCEWLLLDDRIAATLSARTDALMGLTPTFEQGVGRKAKQAVKALEADEDFWQAYPEAEQTQIVTWAILLGVGPAQQKPWVAHPDHGGRMLPTTEFWHPQSVSYNWHTQLWSAHDITGQVVPITLDGSWLLHMPYGSTRPWAGGLWRSLARWALLKTYAIRDWGLHSEKGATLVATAPEKATKQQRKELAEDLHNAGENRVVALANGFDLKLVELSANTREIYEAQVHMADEAIAIRIRGGNLTTSVSDKGSRAAAETQERTGDQAKLRFDANALTNTLHDQSLVHWAQFNYGDPRLAPWPVYPVEAEEDKAKRASMVKTLGEGLTTFRALGWEILEKETKEEFGLSFLGELEEPEPAPTQPPPTTPPPPPPDPDDDSGGTDAAAGTAQARALRSARARLASWTRGEKTSGFISGQLYVDDVVDDSVPAASKALTDSLLKDLLEAIDGADSYEAVREAVLKRYRGAAQPEELRTLLHQAYYLADLAGAASVREDT